MWISRSWRVSLAGVLKYFMFMLQHTIAETRTESCEANLKANGGGL